MKFKYNLQFFGDSDGDGDNNTGNNNTNGGDTGNNNGDDSGSNNGVDSEAFAELISERDKKIEALETEMKALRKSNADLLVKISTGGTTAKKTFDENLLDMVGYKPRKE